MSGFETILYDKRGDLGYITLNRPRVLNVVNVQMRDELIQALGALRDDPDIRVVVIRGAGERAFSAGADLTEFSHAPSRVKARQARWARDLWGTFLSFPKPIIAALHGYVLGAGVEMALCCDIRIASQDALFGLPEVELGMIPAAGGTQTLPRLIGAGKAMWLLLTGERVDAAEAHRLGLVDYVVSKEELVGFAEAMARQILACPYSTVVRAKEAVTRGLNMSLAEGLELEARLAATTFSTPEAREGLAALRQRTTFPD